MTKLVEIRKAVRALAHPTRAEGLQRFFKTGPGEYGEGDRFLGLTVPQVRMLVRRFHPADFAVIPGLVRSPFHEERLLGLLERSPDAVDAWSLLVRVEQARGDLAAAQSAWERLFALDPAQAERFRAAPAVPTPGASPGR